jgi:putative FmdB family regulatory protein
MPNYEYKCKECNTSADHPREVSERDNLPTCGYCGRLTYRVINATPSHFKGSGFYSTGG